MADRLGGASSTALEGFERYGMLTTVGSKRDRISAVVNNATGSRRSADEHYQAGVALASQRRFSDALKEYREAARLNPNSSDTFFNLGVAYGELGQWNAAIKAYKAAISLNPRDWQAHTRRIAVQEIDCLDESTKLRATVGRNRKDRPPETGG